ncbi:Fimbriae protein (modular protein) [Cupriavidus taiwanensis]|uniref:Fimbriae protein (Modular protein) n=1 Tax=Cupriavidus taiwanensis TaxID=164546 RepID=A0A375J8D1_9BURK|nr:Fimbriae protein (modular protein) [Cupriavidus taiwanensis]
MIAASDHSGVSEIMKRLIARFIKDERGATAIEYGLIAGLVALAVAAGATQLGTNLSDGFKSLGEKVVTMLGKPTT